MISFLSIIRSTQTSNFLVILNDWIWKEILLFACQLSVFTYALFLPQVVLKLLRKNNNEVAKHFTTI